MRRYEINVSSSGLMASVWEERFDFSSYRILGMQVLLVRRDFLLVPERGYDI